MATAAQRKQTDESVASEQQNSKLEHPEGGVTTRDDVTDLGVPMLQGDPKEPTGPEDALGEGPKRGDYTGRIGPDNYHPHMVRLVEDAQPGEPQVEVVEQRPLAADIGEVPGKKGGVNSAE